MAEIAVNYVIDKIGRLIKEEVQLLKGVKDEAVWISNQLEHIKAFLRAADEMEERTPEVDVWVKQMRDIAYDVEDALDEYKLRLTQPAGQVLYASLTKIVPSIMARRQVATEFQSIRARYLRILEEHQRFQGETTIVDAKIPAKTWNEYRQNGLLIEEADLVGIERPKRQLINWLIHGGTGREVVSVVGMGGLGKTTLAKKVYDDVEVKLHFKYRAWISVSQSLRMEELLRDLIQQLYRVKKKPVPEAVSSMNNQQLREKINTFLQQKTYLIVLDDVWRIQDWDAIKLVFPNNSGSRVMLTTRHAEVASSSCQEFHGNVYPLNPLTFDESWTLFCRKTFGENSCPQALEGLTKSILKRCEGLPLAIVAISGVLATKERIDEWDLIQRSLGNALQEDGRLHSMGNILSLSYNDLPSHLKSCFLYFSVFPKKHLIDQMKLIRLWIAEGFVKEKDGMALEAVAESYLYELLNRSLIQVATTTSEGRVKTCRIHDLLREILISKSRDENFVTVARGENIIWPEKVRRLSIHKNSQDIIEGPSISHLRSLLVFRKGDPLSGPGKQISFPLELRLLKVLDLRGLHLQVFPNAIVKLLLLKFLSLRDTKMKSIPSSIKNLRYLETLDLKGSCIVALPAEISELKRLRHLLVYRYEIESHARIHSKFGFKAMAELGSFRFLQKLCFIEADRADNDILQELGRLSQLRRLGIVKLRRENGVALSSSIEKMSNLRALSITSIDENEVIDLENLSSPPQFLQRLYLTGRLEKLPHWIPLLHCLAKASLRWSQLKDDPLESLQGLPNLVHLELLQVYEQDTLHFKDGGFQKLKVLGLDKMDGLKTVIIGTGAMPLLETLILQRCKYLQSVPSGIEHLLKLKLLEFYDMPEELIMTVDTDGGDDWKVAHVPEINANYWRDGAWDVYSFERSIGTEGSGPCRGHEPPYFK